MIVQPDFFSKESNLCWVPTVTKWCTTSITYGKPFRIFLSRAQAWYIYTLIQKHHMGLRSRSDGTVVIDLFQISALQNLWDSCQLEIRFWTILWELYCLLSCSTAAPVQEILYAVMLSARTCHFNMLKLLLLNQTLMQTMFLFSEEWTVSLHERHEI